MQNNLNVFMDTIYSAPVWIQEVIYLDIKTSLENRLASVAQNDRDSFYPVFVPLLTFKGKRELETHECNHHINIYKYLEAVSNQLRVIDITLNNFWTLEESSQYLCECIKNELIQPPQDTVLMAAIFYIAGEIRIGEYVKRLNKINAEELDDVLRKQKQHNQEHPEEKLRTGEIMVSMGYVANKDIDKILFTKEEAKKRFIPDNLLKKPQNVQSNPTQNNSDNNADIIQELTAQNQKLTAENKLLKDKLRAIFNIQNRNK